MIYLASPYSHPTASTRLNRFRAVCRAAGVLMNSGHIIFSPIAHTHPIAMCCEMPGDWRFWERYDKAIIARCDELWVLTLDGWRESVGVTAEIQFAREIGKPVKGVARLNGKPITGRWKGGDAVLIDLDSGGSI